LKIPGLGIDAAFTSSSLLKGASTATAGTFRLTASNVNYTALGLWEVDGTIGTTPAIFLGTFVTGYETPVSAVPTSGTATYSGINNVTGIVASYQSGQLARASLLGNGSFSADFGAAKLTGTLTNMTVITANPTATATPWNNVSVTASIAGNHFNGSATAAAPSAVTNYTLTGGAAGNFNGGFYGPNADELAGVWSLTDSSHVVTGVAVGKQN